MPMYIGMDTTRKINRTEAPTVPPQKDASAPKLCLYALIAVRPLSDVLAQATL